MLTKQIENYRKIVTLTDGVTVHLRPMVSSDLEQLVGLFGHISREDARYFREDVADQAVIAHWCETLDYARVLPVLAVANGRAVGDASLHFGKGPSRHLAEVRIFLSRDFRRRGLGSRLIEAIIELARKQDVHILSIQLVADQSTEIKAFQKLGFELCCMLEDYFMLPEGDTRDLAVLLLHLKPKVDEF